MARTEPIELSATFGKGSIRVFAKRGEKQTRHLSFSEGCFHIMEVADAKYLMVCITSAIEWLGE